MVIKVGRKAPLHITVGICTQDFSRVFDLVRLLNERGIDYALIAPGEIVERHIDVAIVEATSPRFVYWHPRTMRPLKDPGVTLDRAVALAFSVFRPRSMVLGIDPGLRTGLALMADGMVIDTSLSMDPGGIPRRLRSALIALRPRGHTIRIGNGDPVRRDAIIVRLFERFGGDLHIEMVDERSTSIEQKRTHEDAATRIARMGGRRLQWLDYHPEDI